MTLAQRVRNQEASNWSCLRSSYSAGDTKRSHTAKMVIIRRNDHDAKAPASARPDPSHNYLIRQDEKRSTPNPQPIKSP